MFTVKFVGGAKKSFPAEYLEINKSDISIKELIPLLSELKPPHSPDLDTENILIAVNGADSSAMDGQSTKIKDNDLVSIIPIIHGGTSKKITFKYYRKQIQAIEIKGQKSTDVRFIDNLRKKYPTIRIQAVSSNLILNDSHMKKIISLSLNSAKNNILLSNKLEIDILMRFALTTQISNAIKNAGIKPKTNFVLIAIGHKKILNLLYDELLPVSADMFSKDHASYLKKHFKITKKHINSVHSENPLEDVLVEKAAILI